MPRIHYACLIMPALIVLAGCGHDEPQPRTTQVIVQPPQQPQQMAVVAPNPPPPPRSEMVPPPPPGVGPVVWQPGHWMLNGNSCLAAAVGSGWRDTGPDYADAGQLTNQGVSPPYSPV